MPEEPLRYKTKKGLYWSFFGNLSNYGMHFIVGIVMARLLSPEDYGITALPIVFMAIANIFIDGGFGIALVRKPNVTDEDLSTAFYYSIAIGFFCYAVLYIAAPYIADFYDTPVLTPLIRVTALTFLWGPLATPQNVILKRKMDFKNPARISIVNKIIGSVVGLSMAFMGYGLWALVISGVVSSLIGFIQTWWVVRWLPHAHFSKKSFQYLWNFGNKMIATNIVSTLYQNIVPVLLGKFGGARDLGMLNRANTFADLPSSNVTNVLSTVSFPALSKIQDDNERFTLVYRKIIRVSAFVIFPIMLMLSALARPVVITTISAKWEACVILLQISCFTRMLQPLQILNLNILQIKGRPDLQLRIEVIKRIVGTVVLTYATINFSLAGLCVTDFFYTLFALAMNSYYSGKLIQINIFQQIKDVMPFLLLSLVMMGFVLLTNMITENMILQMIIGCSVGITIYLGGSYIMNFPELEDVKYLLSKKK